MSDKESTDCGYVAVQRTTAAALLVVDGDGNEYWIPSSQVCDESELDGGSDVGDEGNLWLPEWLAVEKGLV